MSKALTQSEQAALFSAMAHFGPCTCRPPSTCDGHRFLAESTRHADRLDMLLWVRRTAQQWVDAEHMDSVPVLPAVEPEPVAPVLPDSLPW